ncbi:hypothetical protein [Bosea sp. UNC402CLCol]|uniref:hypothetical protein n=1 Tax=Bosea sp. UNC402CLCol TaxID=1510531 RepID=UPI000570E3CB|nr:hypothetical protein [Bosea sp. UNC402CLCol]
MTEHPSDPTEVIEALKELARASFVDNFPNIPEDETIEGEAAIMIGEMLADFRKIAAGASDGAAIAQAWIDRVFDYGEE